MDRRRFIVGLAVAGALVAPLGCGKKNKANPEEGTQGPPPGMKAPPANPAQDKSQDSQG